jgi:hypothetical protein
MHPGPACARCFMQHQIVDRTRHAVRTTPRCVASIFIQITVGNPKNSNRMARVLASYETDQPLDPNGATIGRVRYDLGGCGPGSWNSPLPCRAPTWLRGRAELCDAAVNPLSSGQRRVTIRNAIERPRSDLVASRFRTDGREWTVCRCNLLLQLQQKVDLATPASARCGGGRERTLPEFI